MTLFEKVWESISEIDSVFSLSDEEIAILEKSIQVTKPKDFRPIREITSLDSISKLIDKLYTLTTVKDDLPGVIEKMERIRPSAGDIEEPFI